MTMGCLQHVYVWLLPAGSAGMMCSYNEVRLLLQQWLCATFAGAAGASAGAGAADTEVGRSGRSMESRPARTVM